MLARNRAFTLVELLVVISIIGILIAILLPSLQKSRQSAQAIQCASNQRQVAYGVFTYCDDYKEDYPAMGNGNNSFTDAAAWAVRVIMKGYVGGIRTDNAVTICRGVPQGAMSCPSVTGPYYDLSLVQTTDPAWAEGYFWGGSHFLFNGNINLYFYSNPNFQYACKRRELEAKRAPSKVILFTDGRIRNVNYIGYASNITGEYAADGLFGFGQSYDQRHMKDSANITWADGHVTLSPDTILRTSPDVMPWKWR